MISDPVIRVENLHKAYRGVGVLRGVTFEVLPGQTYAFLGRNGAGKSTTIRTLLGLQRPDSGTVSVLGVDPSRHPITVRKRVGYLAEDQRMFPTMTVSDLIGFISVFYETWDTAWCDRLRNRFELSPSAKVRTLSKGQSVRLGLLLALAHRPELVILDDPVLGLDPIMRKEFNRDLITFLQGEGRTVLYSSHLLYEVEPVADVVAILDKGQIVHQAATEMLREQVKKVVLPIEMYAQYAPRMSILDAELRDGEVRATISNANLIGPELQRGGQAARIHDLNLDEIFEAFVIGRNTVTAQPLVAAH